MRILNVHSGNLFGGIESMLVTQAQACAASATLSPHFALCFPGRLSRALTESGAIVHDLMPVRVSRPWTIPRARAKLRRVLRNHSCDAVICHGAWSLAIFGSVVRDVDQPLFFFLHGMTGGAHWLEKWAKRIAPDRVLCNSQFTARSARGMYPHVPVVVTHPCVSFSHQTLSDADRDLVRGEQNVSGDTVVILLAGRMEPNKGHRTLIRALSELRDAADDWSCWLVGGAQRKSESRFESELRRLVRQQRIEKQVRFLGQRSDVARLMRASDIYCQPNEGPEGFGLTFIEAMAAGLPVVTTAIGGAVETVDDRCGVVIPANAGTSLVARELRRLIEEPATREILGSHGPLRARQLCHPEVHLANLKEALLPVVRVAA